MFADAKVPLNSIGVVVQEVNGRRPLFAQHSDRAFNPASVMKLVTTFAALELLGPAYRWKTEAYLAGALQGGVLHGDLVLKGGGDPKITLDQWQTFMKALRSRGLDRVDGDLVLDRTFFARSRTIPRRSTASRSSRTTSDPTRCWSISSRFASRSPRPPRATHRS
jgi:D-alanyl-D-alanine carboxypeptidase/D-alanyl-D-alanine-endopeptidase (penicillin-binding protein 4)